ncbi:polysaccharide pyruvyl transferase family protein [Aequorivita marisscotiae]|uniref:Polysaccharide pyruvyl transferase family protein n=1 Tax=Aequorivita marisscotiae TaxID=3040348 RepID=A0ABY8KTI6_9FLAO|nr:polysaccharide pyruvyl transferase family protein [Aequorivita sp. Ant34-E75]WGF92749.1 polysaccharide pyruvyl transferase family protein [Aequorivita sp. Ant34-E75]
MGIRLYWWQEKRDNGTENYGDLLSKYIVEKVSQKRVKTISHPSTRVNKYLLKHYLVIGSIISSANRNSIVWGSGIIKKEDTIRPAKFLAVRGPKTRKRILETGYFCPEIYGDPAILLPNFYDPKIEKTHSIGIIPHYVDYQEVKAQFEDNTRVKVIDLLTYDVEKTTRDILQCEHIISSSLHGVIVAHSYNIPAIWTKFSNKLSGDNIKFFDYFESVGIPFKKEIFISPDYLDERAIKSLLNEYSNMLLPDKFLLEKCKSNLLKTCPFNN